MVIREKRSGYNKRREAVIREEKRLEEKRSGYKTIARVYTHFNHTYTVINQLSSY